MGSLASTSPALSRATTAVMSITPRIENLKPGAAGRADGPESSCRTSVTPRIRIRRRTAVAMTIAIVLTPNSCSFQNAVSSRASR